MKNITCKTAQTQQKVTRRPLRRAVALLAAGELGVDVGGEQRESGGDAFENGDERLSVRLAGGGEADHGASNAVSPTQGRAHQV